jgi:hypothetical protein
LIFARGILYIFYTPPIRLNTLDGLMNYTQIKDFRLFLITSFSDYSTICLGIVILFRDDWIFPECNHSRNSYGGKGFFSFGIGVRAALGGSETKAEEETNKQCKYYFF